MSEYKLVPVEPTEEMREAGLKKLLQVFLCPIDGEK